MQVVELTNTNNPFCFIFLPISNRDRGFKAWNYMVQSLSCLSCFVIVKDQLIRNTNWVRKIRTKVCSEIWERNLQMSKYALGVSIAVRKYPVTSRTWKSSSLAAKVVPGELGVRIARCTLHFLKEALERGLFFCQKNLCPYVVLWFQFLAIQ